MGRLEVILADTHVVVWAVEEDKRLGRNAIRLLNEAAEGDDLFISVITCWEIALLAERGKLALSLEVGLWLERNLNRPGVRWTQLEPAISVDSVRLPGNFHSDPADRWLVATARHFGIPLLTADRAILAYSNDQGHVATVDASL
ncbi:PIN domain nuclease of toxin-antitoxin system [Neorhizobium sp. R1-B]|uniref:type II toxin-antitoxin system VapC family toxin n=1 Tax=unclassified Neorhizobium TaxID=2629175 RepID=UPI0010E8ABF3|nr:MULTISPECIES: type II toxin-antitoxin system VapC family toxin [unclassified Neorhizobium]TCV74524.1 PIN domain nuclease of toxin-antitoxin system [Neorhizobium sp. S3-V5DH]TDX87710.1 PIN domain nuclease of toxin-antitoxin system [Neorhizobium sp. R1-B]